MYANPRFVLRAAEAADVEILAAMTRLHVEYGMSPSWRRAHFRTALRDPRAVMDVIDDRGEIAGFVLARAGGRLAHLQLLVVMPAVRRRGLGRRLLRQAESRLRIAGADCLRLEVRAGNAGARRFYGRHGYCLVTVRPDFYPSGESALVLARRLAAPQPALA